MPLDLGDPCDPCNDLCNADIGATCSPDATCAIAGPAHIEGECQTPRWMGKCD